jgi:hypothetical protein
VSFNPITAPVDHVLLGGRRTPGLASLEGVSSPRKWDVRKPHGGHGATIVFTGTDVARFKLLIRLYTVQHWADWDAFRDTVQKVPDPAAPRALDIVHPYTDAAGIRSVVVEDVLQPRETSDNGEWTIEVHLLEYRPPVRTVARPDGSSATPTLTDPVEIRIQALTTRHQVNQIALGVPQ